MSNKKNQEPDDREFCLEQETTSDESIQEVHDSLMHQKESTRAGFPILPIMMVLFFSLLMLVGGIYMADYGVRFSALAFDETRDPATREPEEPSKVDMVAMGQGVYRTCAACHGPEGQGTPGVFPPLVDTDWVLGSKDRLIRIVLNGLTGPIEVRGETYNMPMGGLGGALNDREVAAVLTYIRQAWGNEASEVTLEEVSDVRSEVGTRGPWTAEELEQFVD